MCSHVSCVNVTCAPPCAAFIPAMHACTLVTRSFSAPINTPHTSVFPFERACCRIWRTTSVLIWSTGALSFLGFDITHGPLRAPPALLPHHLAPNTRFLVNHFAPCKYQTGAALIRSIYVVQR